MREAAVGIDDRPKGAAKGKFGAAFGWRTRLVFIAFRRGSPVAGIGVEVNRRKQDALAIVDDGHRIIEHIVVEYHPLPGMAANDLVGDAMERDDVIERYPPSFVKDKGLAQEIEVLREA